jgi:hypothetical protein
MGTPLKNISWHLMKPTLLDVDGGISWCKEKEIFLS